MPGPIPKMLVSHQEVRVPPGVPRAVENEMKTNPSKINSKFHKRWGEGTNKVLFGDQLIAEESSFNIQ